jgi:hypothetical protein
VQATGDGKTQGVSASWTIASAVLALIVSVGAIVFAESRATPMPTAVYSAPSK